MINNSYPFSLKLFLKLQGIDHLLIFCPLSKTKILKYEKDFQSARKDILGRVGGLLPIAHKNINVSEADLSLLSTACSIMIEHINTELKDEKRKNVISSFEVLKTEFEDLRNLLP